MLSAHPRKNEEAFKSVDELLRKIPLNALGLDLVQWSSWSQECAHRLARKHYEAYPELERVVQVNFEFIRKMEDFLKVFGWFRL